MSKFLNNINLEAGNDIQFKTTAGANAGKIEQDGNNLVLSNAAGDVLLGDGSSDVYIGDGTNNVDILFEQSGSIKGDGSAITLTIGGANTTLNLENPNINGTLSLGATSINNKLTFTTANGYILFDHEPSGDTGAYEGTTSVPLLKIDTGGTEKSILERVSQQGGILLGADDSVIIAAGDTRNTLRSNLNEAAETVIFASEGGFHAYGFPSNDTTWTNRNEFRFRADSGTASDNGLYIGDGSSTQFIDLSRNLKNIGTIGAGTITSTGHVAATEFRPTNIVTNKVVKFNGTQLDDANITDTGSLITLGSNTTLDGVLGVEVGNAFYSTPLLEITSSGTPTQIKITTNIPWSSTHAHVVTIRGFRYGGAEMSDLQIGWHVYNNSFYNRAITSSGSWAPVVRLAVENSKVVIHLDAPGYWPKLYVESLYNAFGGTDDATGWSWADAAISADSGTPNQTVPYKINFGGGEIKAGSNTVFHDGYHPNADTLTTARTITLAGDVTGNVSFNGSSDVSITTVVGNDSHTHTKLSGFSHQVEYDLIRAGNSNGLYMKARWDGSTSNRFWDMGYVDGNGTFTSGLKVINGGDITYKGNEMWHAGNDGSGSGLDADTLDAQEGSYYRNASNLNAGTIAAARLSTASTQPPNDNSTKIATTAYVQTELTDLIGTAPAALDTLSELADAINDDASFSSTVTTALGNRLRVDTASQGLNATQKSNARTNLGLGSAAIQNTSAFMGASGMAANTDVYMNFRVLRNSNSTTANDGMYIGYGNSNNGQTRIFGGGSTGVHLAINATNMAFNSNTVWHAGNDGSGSGLDADLLDGNHAAAFATSAQGTKADNALPKAGGTMTGSLQVSVGGAIGINIKQDTGSPNISGRLFFSNQTAGEGVSIYNADNKMMFQTGATFNSSTGSTRMTILASGNVGIGTTSPLEKLHVNGGNINIQNVASSSPFVASGKLRFLGKYDRYLGGINTVNTGSYAEYDNGLDFYVQRDTFNAAGHFAMRITHSGNVGIGTASPTSPLTIKSNSVSSANSGFTLQANANTNALVRIGEKSNNKARLHMYASGVEKIAFYTDGTANHISAGNVGIGTTTPTAPLHIDGGTESQVLKIEADSNPYIRWIQNGTNVGFLQFNGGSAYLSNMANGSLFIRTNNTDKMTITSAGNVGIGTTSPDYQLDIENSSHATARLHAGANSSASLRLQNDAQHFDVNLQTNDKFAIYDHTAGTQPFTILPTSGNVGIGTTSPSYKLDVAASGGIRAGGKTTYTKNFPSGLDTSGELVAEITSGYNGASALFEFTCFGGNAGCYQRVIWSLYNASGTWYASNPINEGTNHFDVAYSSGEFTFKTRSGTQAYQPRVIVEAAGDSIDNSYA